jgi:3-oxoacyl-[acyl-carrier-protein] synthase II
MLGAARHAKLDGVSGVRCGVSLGSSGVFDEIEDYARIGEYYRDDGSFDHLGYQRTGAESLALGRNYKFGRKETATEVALRLLRFHGPSQTISSTCAAGTQAIGEAYWAIVEGEADVMLAGGCDSLLNFTAFASFDLLSALSNRYNDAPQSASRPFDRRRDGFVMGEGGAAVVLESLSHATRRGAHILAEVKGYASSCDAYRITDSAPDAIGAVLAIQGSLESAGLEPPDIDYVNMHGTSTLVNDRTETLAIKKVFGPSANSLPTSSIKSMIGHSIAGAGAIECVTCVIAMEQSLIPPTINQEHADPACDLDYVPNHARPMQLSHVMSNSFGFGGQNGSLILSRHAQS